MMDKIVKEQAYIIINHWDSDEPGSACLAYCNSKQELISALQAKIYKERYQHIIGDIEVYPLGQALTEDELLELRSTGETA